VRVIVATHHNLPDLVKKGVFREDLYHRIYVFPLLLPPLRERDGEIPPLVAHFAAQVCQVNGWKPKVFLPDAIQELERYAWPGNVRELRNMVERLLLLADGAVDAALVRLALPAGEGDAPAVVAHSGSLAARTDAFEREQILAELKRNHQRMTDTAKALGLERSHVYKECQAWESTCAHARAADAGLGTMQISPPLPGIHACPRFAHGNTHRSRRPSSHRGEDRSACSLARADLNRVALQQCRVHVTWPELIARNRQSVIFARRNARDPKRLGPLDVPSQVPA
jgi:hypothetical protein